MTPHLDHPPAECELCGRWAFWRALRPGSPWICAVCVPPLLEPDQFEWHEEATPW